MAYSQSKKLTDTEKRLQTLKIQLFGKDKHEAVAAVNQIHKSSIISSPAFATTATLHSSSDMTYLKKDLLKILILASIAIGAQIVLYLQFTFKILKFN